MKKYIFLIISLCFLFIIPLFTQGSIKINEVVIDQSPQGVELINSASTSANISNWYLDDSGGMTYFTIPTDTILYPNSCLIFYGEFNLNKTTPDTIRLFDSMAPPTATNSSIIDSYSYKSSPGAEKSYARIPDGLDTWVVSNSTLGKNNETGINCIIIPTPTPTATPTTAPTDPPLPSETPLPASPAPLPSYDNIFISEVMVYPDSGQHEWIELYNNNDFTVSLRNWYLDDTENSGASPKLISIDIPVKSYALIELSSSLFNNDGDSVRLLDQNKIQKDGFEYLDPHQGTSLGRINWDDDTFCQQSPTKGQINNDCMQSDISKSNTAIASVMIPSSENVNKSKASLEKNSSGLSYLYKSTQNYASNASNNAIPEILGETTINRKIPYSPHNSPLVNHLSFLSFSYSFLTIVSLLVKIKNGF